MLHLTFSLANLTATSILPPPPRRRWRLHRLKDPDICNQYLHRFTVLSQPLAQQLDSMVNTLPTQPPPLEALSDSLCQSIYSALDDSVQPSHHDPGRPIRWFWTEELQRSVEHREHCYRKWRHAIGTAKLDWWLKLQEARAKFRSAVRQRRQQTWQAFCNRMASREFPATAAKVSKLKRGRTLSPTFSHPDGPQAAADAMQQYLATVFSGSLLTTTAVPDSQLPIPFLADDDDQSNPFSVETVKAAIQAAPSQKAPGVDHLRAEMLYPISDALAPILAMMYTLCWRWGQTPLNWRVAQVIPIHKKDSPSDPANFRPISLTSVLRKIMENCLKHLLISTGPHPDIAQGGFRASRGTLDQALCLHKLCLFHQRATRSPPNTCFPRYQVGI